MAKKLTDAAIHKIRPTDKPREIPDGGCGGLYLVIHPSGKKAWAVRYRYQGRPRKLTLLHPFPDCGVAQAHEEAATALRAVREGGDPAGDMKARRATIRRGDDNADRDLVRNVVADFLKRHASKNRSAAETERLFNREVLPAWGDRQLASITRREILDLLDGIVERGRGTTANRVLSAVRRFFNWTVERDILPASPCAGVKPPAKERSRDRILSDNELRLLWKACDGIGYPFGPLVKMLLVTAQREQEVGSATWLEFSDADWTIPAARAKNGVEHSVPLSSLAASVLGSLPRIEGKAGYLFTTTGQTAVSGFSRAKKILDREMGPDVPHWTFHDLRRTAASGMARLGINLPVIEKVLNHVSGSFAGIVGVYQRHSYADEKRAALETWGRFLKGLIADGEVRSNVVALRK